MNDNIAKTQRLNSLTLCPSSFARFLSRKKMAQKNKFDTSK
ncbi:hypothetical protein PPHE_a2544 [Pseudoalteromonas phenolica O-BC30]|nr:hypothetical protein [Pseudoalteromonas phenolica O-BC30]